MAHLLETIFNVSYATQHVNNVMEPKILTALSVRPISILQLADVYLVIHSVINVLVQEIPIALLVKYQLFRLKINQTCA